MAELSVDKLQVTQLGSTQTGTFLTPAQTASLLNPSGGGGVVGQAFYGFGSGTYTWTCPPGVTSVSVVCIGGGSSTQGSTWSATAGAGGGLGWKNNIAVTPGQTYTVQVGQGGNGSSSNTSGGDSWFISSGTVRGGGASTTTGGSFTGDGGGNGGAGGNQYGGGGAGGYTGNGGTQGQAGSGGGASGGAGYSSTYGGASGGGTGPFGQGQSGSATSSGQPGVGGSGGENGIMGENPWYSQGVTGNRRGGLYGGGGAGTGTSGPGGIGLNEGGRGCVRIIWGAGRSFPSTGTGDM